MSGSNPNDPDETRCAVLLAIKEAHARPIPLTAVDEENFFAHRRQSSVGRERGVFYRGPGKFRWSDVRTGPFRTMYPPLAESLARVRHFEASLRPDGRLFVAPGRKVVNRRAAAVRLEADILDRARRLKARPRDRAALIARVLGVTAKHVRLVIKRNKANL